MFASREQRAGRSGRADLAFTDRHGGVSPAPYDSLHLGDRAGGRTADVNENFSLLAREFGVSDIATMRQRHGSEVVQVTGGEPAPECDGLITTVPGLALCVRAGDCVPVLLADVDAGVVGAAHAGRRGLVVGVVPATVAAMRTAGARDVVGWIGPYICSGCYEVPAEMRAEVAASVPAAFSCTTAGSPSVDLGAAVTAQLVAAGCRVEDRSTCTLESPDLFSYRRDAERSGRSAGLVVLLAAS